MENLNNKRVLILVDYANWHYYLKKVGWKIDWARFTQYFDQRFKQISICYFGGIISWPYFRKKNPGKTKYDFYAAKQEKEDIFKAIKSCGIGVVSKPICVIYDSTTGKTKSKCNFDVEITIKAIDKLSEYDILILCTGDGDFIKLVKYIKGHFKTVMLIAPADRTNPGLKKAANNYVQLASLRQFFELAKKKQTEKK